MVYRIRYRDRCNDKEAEAVVEANSPTEALVKFRHVHGAAAHPTIAPEGVTSICAEDPEPVAADRPPKTQAPDVTWPP